MFVKGIQFPNVLSQKWLVRPFVENNVPPVNIYLREEINLIQEILMICLPDSTQITWVGNIWLKESGSRKKKIRKSTRLIPQQVFSLRKKKMETSILFPFSTVLHLPRGDLLHDKIQQGDNVYKYIPALSENQLYWQL